MSVVVDRMTRKILATLEVSLPLDHHALAKQVGCAEEVVRHRITQLEEAGLLQGVRLRCENLPGQSNQEALLLGVPGPTTDPRAFERLGTAPGVLRVFTLASAASVVIHMRGTDAADVDRKAAAVAAEAGLQSHQVVLVLQTIWGRQMPLEA